MKQKINIFMAIYLVLIFVPIALIVTTISALLTIIVTPFAGEYRWSYYPGLIWSRIMCFISFVRVKIEGKNNIDKNKSYIFVANHQSIYDVFLVYGWLNSKFKWIMKKELRRIPLVGKACEMAGHIFIDRSNKMRARESLLAAEKKLKNGNSVFLFPEGTRTRDGKVGKFKRGAFKIACDIHLPIVPVSIIGAYDVLPYRGHYIQPGKIKMIIHEPIDTTNLNEENINDFVIKVRNIVNESVEKES